jgi:8-oxo-dGTP diphosphatase
LVFPWRGEKVLVCDIADRGWCIPSGRVEPAESSLDAVRREAVEEGGAMLECLQYIGCYQITERNEVRWADCYVAHVGGLGDIQVIEESKGRRFMTLDDLAEHYHVWNELTEQVFRFSYEVYARSRGLAMETLGPLDASK